MGCDIHCFVEAKNKETGEWEFRGDAPSYDNRNYDTFAILANVRNGWGFAGVVTGQGFNSISMPRGVPADISSLVEEERERWDGAGHSYSFFNLKELLAYDWDQGTEHQGIVNRWEYQETKERGKPKSWCGEVSGPGIKKVTNEEMDALIASGAGTSNHYTTVHWKESYRESASDFCDEFLPELQKFAESCGLEQDEVRIVFWFDN